MLLCDCLLRILSINNQQSSIDNHQSKIPTLTHILMDYKKSTAPNTTITRNLAELEKDTENIYKSLTIISRRANQISVDMKHELNTKLEEFASYTDNLEEVFENREQIEISRYYEKLPKPSLLAVEEFRDDEIYYRDGRDNQNDDIV